MWEECAPVRWNLQAPRGRIRSAKRMRSIVRRLPAASNQRGSLRPPLPASLTRAIEQVTFFYLFFSPHRNGNLFCSTQQDMEAPCSFIAGNEYAGLVERLRLKSTCRRKAVKV